MVENIHKLLYQWITLYVSGVVVLLLIIAVSETVVPLETKALPVKNTCPPVDFSKRQKTG